MTSAPRPAQEQRPPAGDAPASLRERFDEPIARATELTRITLAWFPVRVWRHFLQHNGFLLAASISYQSLFAIFAVIYASFAAVGLWLGGSTVAIQRLIDLINSYIPNLISDEGLVSPKQVQEIAQASSGVLALTGVIALGVAIWTAVGFITFARRAVRDIFGLPFDLRNYFLLKARDFVAAFALGLALVVGAALGWLASGALDFLASVLGWNDAWWIDVPVKLLSIVVAFIVNGAALAAMFRFLSGASLPWRRIWPGALLAGAAIAALQLGVGFLLLYSPSNPLLATFSVFVGFLLWFRIIGIVILVGAAWIAVAASDRDIPLRIFSETERRAAEHAALVTAARVRLRAARRTRDAASWFRRWKADRAVRAAEDELERIQSAAPEDPTKRGLFD